MLVTSAGTREFSCTRLHNVPNGSGDLLEDTPYNTYTRAGLPPTPIAMPGKAALEAAVRPPASDALYFVARGDGTSQFSASLDDHNRAVTRYQLRGGR